MLPALVSTFRLSSRWLERSLVQDGFQHAELGRCQTGGGEPGFHPRQHRPAGAQQLYIGVKRRSGARIGHASAVHHHRQPGALQHMARYAAEDELAQTGV